MVTENQSSLVTERSGVTGKALYRLKAIANRGVNQSRRFYIALFEIVRVVDDMLPGP
jgi:hypothetical protein